MQEPSLLLGPVQRRRALAAWIAASAGGMGALGLHASAMEPSPPAPARKRLLTAQTTEGPYYLAGTPTRADITEGLPGVPLTLRLTLSDTEGTPLAGLRVEVWQCDAQGLYSGFAGQTNGSAAELEQKTFLRGGLLAGQDGEVRFHTIYPGWYEGRTTHIHVKVLNGARAVLTSQFFLPDALSEYIYTHLPGYRRQQLRNVLNSTDGIAIRAGETVIGSVTQAADRYLATLALVVDPAASPVVHRPMPGNAPAPGMGGRGGPPPGFGGTPHLKPLEGPARIRAMVPGT